MKTLKIFLMIVLGTIVIVVSSCKKEDTEPKPDKILGLEMDKRLSAAADSLALQMGQGYITVETERIDPITGEVILNPETGKPYMDMVEIPITAERQYRIIANMALSENYILSEDVIEYKKTKKEKILFGFPEEELTQIIYRQTENGDIYKEKLCGLNDLSAVADNGLTVTQMITNIFDNAEKTAVNAAMEYCRERIIYYNNNTKSLQNLLSEKEVMEIIQGFHENK